MRVNIIGQSFLAFPLTCLPHRQPAFLFFQVSSISLRLFSKPWEYIRIVDSGSCTKARLIRKLVIQVFSLKDSEIVRVELRRRF